jgi:hypothetical protein
MRLPALVDAPGKETVYTVMMPVPECFTGVTKSPYRGVVDPASLDRETVPHPRARAGHE